MDPNGHEVVRFGVFEFDLVSHELRKQGLKIRLSEQPVQMLLLLVERAGEVVTREELRQRLWPSDTFVDFNAGLNSAIKKLRDALGDSAENPRFIETLSRRGYRLIAPIVRAPIDQPATPPEQRPSSGAPVSGRPLRKRWVVTVALATLVAIMAWLIAIRLSDRLFSGNRHGRDAPHIESIAVLPFENLAADSEHQYVVDGISEALTTNLAQFKALTKVAPRTSTMRYKRGSTPLIDIARELDVNGVVDGAVMVSGNRVRVTVQLIDPATNRHLWVQSYEREVRDVLAMEVELARQIAMAIRIELQPEEQRRLERSQSVVPEAYDEYLKARFYWSAGPQNLSRAQKHFETAIQRDPTFALAYSGLSDTYRSLDVAGLLAPKDSMPRAEALARKALALDPRLAEAHASLAGVLYRYYWKWAEAEQEFGRARDLDPNYAEGHRARAFFLGVLRRYDEAIAAAQRARELDPLSPVTNIELAQLLMRAGRYDEAIEQVHRTEAIAPDLPRVRTVQSQIYLRMGDPSRALATLEQSRASRGPAMWFGYLCALNGREQEARSTLATLHELGQREHVYPQSLALIHLGLGEKEQALSLLEQAFEEHDFEMPGLSAIITDLLHDEPRFRQLLQRMGLAAQPGYAALLAGRSSR